MTLTAQDVAQMLQFALVAWLIAIAGYVMYAVLLHGRALRQMLLGENGSRRIAPERVATLGIILMVAGYYVMTGLNADTLYDAATDSYWMPDIPQSLLILLAGGKSIFFAGKLARTQS